MGMSHNELDEAAYTIFRYAQENPEAVDREAFLESIPYEVRKYLLLRVMNRDIETEYVYLYYHYNMMADEKDQSDSYYGETLVNKPGPMSVIKMIREVSGLSLKESKNIYENLSSYMFYSKTYRRCQPQRIPLRSEITPALAIEKLASVGVVALRRPL